MDNPAERTAYHGWSDGDLVGLLHRAGDRLPAGAVWEIGLRHESMSAELRAIIQVRAEWAKAGNSSWAAIHAFLLYADYAGKEDEWKSPNRWSALLAAVRYALAYDLQESYLAALPHVVASQGPWVWERLAALAHDGGRSCAERRVWLLALADTAHRDGCGRNGRLDELRTLAANAKEPRELRAYAARRLLDFVRPGDRELIDRIAVEEEAGPGYAELLPEEVAAAYAAGAQDRSAYSFNWRAGYFCTPMTEGAPVEPWTEAPVELTDLPLPSWREEERRDTLRWAPNGGDDADDGVPNRHQVRQAAECMIESLVVRRFVPVRFWRMLDIAEFVAFSVREREQLPPELRRAFAEASSAFLDRLARAEVLPAGRAASMRAWLLRRAERLGRLVSDPK